MTRYDRRSIALAVALASLAGYVDALGLLSSGRFFVSFMSGNSTRLGVSVAQGKFSFTLAAAGVVALFVAGVVGGTLVAQRTGYRRKPAVLFLVTLLLALAALFHELRTPHVGTAALILAMGAENSVFQREGEVSIGVTYMTGALVKLGQRLAAIATGGARTAWVPYALLWLGLVSGATLGAMAHGAYAMRGLWPAVAAALLLTALTWRMKSPPL